MIISLILIIIFTSFCAIPEKYIHEDSTLLNYVGNFFGVLCVLGFAGFIVGVFSNIFPFTYEKLNAEIIANIIFCSDNISINNRIIAINEISKLNISPYFYKGLHEIMFGNNLRITPYYRIGKGNFVEIKTKNNEEINAEFLINAKGDIPLINEYFAKIVIDNKIDLDLDKLYNLPDNIKTTGYFKNFVTDLLIKKEIECGYGISLIGYDSDKEAKMLREKYCS